MVTYMQDIILILGNDYISEESEPNIRKVNFLF